MGKMYHVYVGHTGPIGVAGKVAFRIMVQDDAHGILLALCGKLAVLCMLYYQDPGLL